jgi:hypothetical protein
MRGHRTWPLQNYQYCRTNCIDFSSSGFQDHLGLGKNMHSQSGIYWIIKEGNSIRNKREVRYLKGFIKACLHIADLLICEYSFDWRPGLDPVEDQAIRGRLWLSDERHITAKDSPRGKKWLLACLYSSAFFLSFSLSSPTFSFYTSWFRFTISSPLLSASELSTFYLLLCRCCPGNHLNPLLLHSSGYVKPKANS